MNNKPVASWKKGQSGNLKGRPRTPLSDALRKAVARTITTKAGKKVIIQDAMAEAIVGEAIKGDVQAFNVIANRIEGMPAQATDVTSGGKPIPIIDVYSHNRVPEDTEADPKN